MRIVFFAKILPERFALGAPEVSYEAKVPALDITYKTKLSFYASQVMAQVDIGEPVPDIDTIKNIIESDIRSFVDYYGFFHGVRFDVDMISAVDAATNWRVFGIDIPILKARLAGSQDELLRKYFLVAFGRPECSTIMADIREAMRTPPNTGFHCYRAIESMAQAMKVKPNEKNSEAWEKLRNSLRIERACLDAIKRHADPPRHDRQHAMTDAERAYVFQKVQGIVLRYLEYLLRNEQPLPEGEFPMLEA